MTVFGFVGASHFSEPAQARGIDGGGRRAHLRRHGAAAGARRRTGGAPGTASEGAMARKADHDGLRLDEAARAGWLYYVAGNTQDEIARKLGISRQAAQRLVSLAISERLIKVRLDHPIARCMELAAALQAALRPALSATSRRPTRTRPPRRSASPRSRRPRSSAGCAGRSPAIIGIGTGRTMRAVADQLPAMECPQHKLVALVGTDQGRRLGLVLRRHHPRLRHACARRTIRCRCRSSRARSRSASC